jgi:hypothetical protein
MTTQSLYQAFCAANIERAVYITNETRLEKLKQKIEVLPK